MRAGRCWSGAGPVESSTSLERPRAVGQRRPARRACAARRRRRTSSSGRRRPAPASRSTPTTLAPDLGVEVARAARRACGELAQRAPPRTSAVSRTGGRRRPSCWISVASAGIEPGRGAADVGVVGPVGGPADEARRRRSTGATSVMSLRWVPPANGSLSDDLVAGLELVAERVDGGAPPTPASSRGARGCARPARAARPSAVNSAAEQSARSLMLGLNAARRSTAPISSAMPVEPGDQDLRAPPGRASSWSPSRRSPVTG